MTPIVVKWFSQKMISAGGKWSVVKIAGSAFAKAGGIVSAVVTAAEFTILLYRWFSGELTGREFKVKAAKCIVAGVAGFAGAAGGAAAGAILGAKLGAIVGGPLAPFTAGIGALIGSIIGGVVAASVAEIAVTNLLTDVDDYKPTPKDEDDAFENAASRLGLTKAEARKEKDVKEAYRYLARKYHPDKHPEASVDELRDYHNRFIEVNLAYEIIKKYLKKRGLWGSD